MICGCVSNSGQEMNSDPMRLTGDKQGKVAVAQCDGSGRVDKLAHFAGLGCADNHQLDAVRMLREIAEERTVGGDGANVDLRIVRSPNRDIAIEDRLHPVVVFVEYAIILQQIESRLVCR